MLMKILVYYRDDIFYWYLKNGGKVVHDLLCKNKEVLNKIRSGVNPKRGLLRRLAEIDPWRRNAYLSRMNARRRR